MEQTIATAVTATPAAASGFADFFATIFAYVASIGLVKLMVSLFMQMVIAITTVLGVGSLTAQAILVFGLILVVIGLVFSVGKLFDAGKAVYGFLSVWVLSLAERFTKKAEKPAAEAPAAA